MSNLKKLQQSDFKSKIIQDLGTIGKNRCAIFECTYCKKHIKQYVHAAKKSKLGRCYECRSIIHGDKKENSEYHRLYTIWRNMKSRCYNRKEKAYINYGKRGIIVCEEWKNNYTIFKKWSLENGYKNILSIDRINNDGNYEPDNCRWTTKNVQARNTRMLRKDNTSGYRGVTKRGDKWVSRIVINNIKILLGYYSDKIKAAIAYNDYIAKNNLEHTKNIIGE